METETTTSECASELNEIPACGTAGTEGATVVSTSSFAKKDSAWTQRSLNDSESAAPPRNQKQEDSKSSKRFGGGDELEHRYKLCLRAEIVGLCVLIVIVWGLLSLPIVFYHLPVVSENETLQTVSQYINIVNQ